MNTRNFKCFQIVYEERNLQVAASKLFLSPQGLSKIIKSIEDECGTPLFIRTKEGFVPTESGKLFYEKSKIIIRDINDMFSAIEAVNDKDKRFKMGFAAGTLRALDIHKIHSFMRDNPQILASWYECDNDRVLKQVINDEISFGFLVGKPNVNNVISKLVRSVEMVVYVHKGHRFWNVEEIDISDLKDEAIISMNEKYHIFHDILNACHLNGFMPNIVARVSEGYSIYQLVRDKVGIGISPRFFDDCDDVKAIRIKDAYTWDVYGIYRSDTLDYELCEKMIQDIEK
ncbi:MAG: LysR family transcriptional regulator [Pseudobutyrivibrio sp.]|nr:LysR family transcriptional regulator [Pseudobutyrivibrio sp.]